jgi:hypothetical protein
MKDTTVKAMIAGAAAVLLAVGGGAIGQQATAKAPATPTAATPGCVYIEEGEIRLSGGRTPDKVTLRSSGPRCADAVLLVVVRTAGGQLLHADAINVAMSGIIADITPGTETEALRERMKSIVASAANLTNTAKLPQWPEGADQPPTEDAEVFYNLSPERWVNREVWNDWRAAKVPAWCYASSYEGFDCIAVFKDDVGNPYGTYLGSGGA